MAGKRQQTKLAPKKLSNPVSTGAGGVNFEAQVQAAYLLAMLIGSPNAVLGNGVVREIRWQARIHGFHTDDLVCSLQVAEEAEPYQALLQVKRTAKAIPSDDAFVETVYGAWLDFLNPALFHPERDRLVIVHAGRSGDSMIALEEVTRYARGSLSYEELERKATTPGFSSQAIRFAFDSIKTILFTRAVPPAQTDDQIHAFLKCVWVVTHRLDTNGTPELAELQERIGLVLGPGQRPGAVWSELVTTSLRLNHEAASLSLANLDSQVPQPLAKAFARHRNSAAAALSLSTFSSTTALGLQGAPEYRPESRGAGVDLSVLARSTPFAVAEMPPPGRAGSGSIITTQLDAINEKLKQCRYRDASEDIKTLGRDLGPFDEHQKARWYLQRGTCYWHLGDLEAAAESFLKAGELSKDDDRVVAAQVRGLLLLKKNAEALEAAEHARERFPESLRVLLVHLNARLVLSEPLEMRDVPASFRGEADVLQMLAWARRNHDDWPGALAYAREAIKAPGASFFTHDTALSLAVGFATRDGVSATYRLLDDDTRAMLNEVIQSFESRSERLWNVQSVESVTVAATHLGLAHLLVGDAAGAMKVVEEAAFHGVKAPAMMRVELEALNQLERFTTLFERGKVLLPELTADGLVMLAQTAANQGELGFVELVLKRAETMEDPQLAETLRAIHWVALWNAKEREKCKSVVLAADLPHATSLPLISAGIRVIIQTGDDALLDAVIQRAEELTQADSQPASRMFMADLLYEAKRYAAAAPYYQSLLPTGQHSELHNRLLSCYVRSLQWHRAKNLLGQFPPGWIEDDGARALALELGDGAGDWAALAKVAEAELRDDPKSAGAWLLKLMTRMRTEPIASAESFLATAPLDIDGSVAQLQSLAIQELKFGLHLKGMQRLYRLRRMRGADIGTASALYASFVAVTESLPHLESELPVVAAGTSFVLADDEGGRRNVTIDPTGIPGLSRSGEFIDETAPEAALFLGRRVGQSVELHTGQTVIVQSISSAYLRLLELAKRDMDGSLVPIPGAMQIRLPEGPDGVVDFSHLHAELKEVSRRIEQAMEHYRTLPITLGMFGRMIGRTTFDVVRGWRSGVKATPLYVCAGTEEERAPALKAIASTSEAGFVVDAGTLMELALLDALPLLSVLSKVYVTSSTRDMVLEALDSARRERSGGVAFDNDGRLGYTEYSAEDLARNRATFEAIEAAIATRCEVVPAYGPDEVHQVIAELRNTLTDEEQAVLLAATERGLRLFTVDGRLRALASHMGVEGVWPQVVMMYAFSVEKFDGAAYSRAALRMFLSNRSFVSLGPQDILNMCLQGTSWLRHGLARFKQYLADSSTDFASAARVVRDSLDALVLGTVRVGAWVEIARHLYAALLRHKSCPPSLRQEIIAQVRSLFRDDTHHPYPPLAEIARAKLSLELRYVAGKLDEAIAWQGDALFDKPVNVEVLRCGVSPWLVVGQKEDEAHDEVTVEGAQAQTPGETSSGPLPVVNRHS